MGLHVLQQELDWQVGHDKGNDHANQEDSQLVADKDVAGLEELDQLQKRERYILLARILEERSFTELAQELQIGYKGALLEVIDADNQMIKYKVIKNFQ